jgi:hypothetical protein
MLRETGGSRDCTASPIPSPLMNLAYAKFVPSLAESAALSLLDPSSQSSGAVLTAGLASSPAKRCAASGQPNR